MITQQLNELREENKKLRNKLNGENDLDLEDMVSFSHHYVMVWGDAEGFVIEDDLGLVMAADEGAWGGAISGESLDFSVSLSAAPIAQESSECSTTDGYEIVFGADENVSVPPVSSATLTLDGLALTAMAIRAAEFGPGTNCFVTDQTDYMTWAVAR